MTRRGRWGAVLLGVGVGSLLSNLNVPLLVLLPLAVVGSALLLWRQIGSVVVRTGTVAALLAWVAVSAVSPTASPTAREGRALASYEASEEQLELWQNVEHLILINAVGDVYVNGGNALAVSAEYRGERRGAKAPQTLQAIFDDESRTLRVTGVDPRLREGERRGLSARLELAVPSTVQVSVTSGLGDISVGEVAALDAHTTVGDIWAEGVAGSSLTSSDVGSVTLSNMLGNVQARTRVGNIDLNFVEPPKAAIKAQTEVGDVKLSLPPTSDVVVHATSKLRDLVGLEQLTATEGQLLLGDRSYEIELSSTTGGVEVVLR